MVSTQEKYPKSSAEQAASVTASLTLPSRLDSRDIFRDARKDVVIEHAGDEYHLKLTRQNKLILTK